jgi:hypothetical protein
MDSLRHCARWLCAAVFCGCSSAASDAMSSQLAAGASGSDGSKAPASAAAGAGSAARVGSPGPESSAAGTAGALPRAASMPTAGAAAGGSASPRPHTDAGAMAAGSAAVSGSAAPPPLSNASPGTFKVFDQIPQFGMYATSDPKNYTPPAGVLLWKHGTEFVAKLSAEQRAQIGADLKVRVTYHAQCDNYDRIGSSFFLRTAPGHMPSASDPRTELVRFITPFSDSTRGALATYVYPDSDVASYASTLVDPTQDVWIGIGGGSNPYDGDPCSNGDQPDDFKAIGFKYSLELVSTQPLTAATGITLTALYNTSAMQVPVTSKLDNPGASVMGHVTVIVSGHGSDSGGDEYMNTLDSLSLNGQAIGSFDTKIDCASYAKFSPDGNQGIFMTNDAGNPRNWCPGALVPPHVFPAMLNAGSNSLSLAIDPSKLPSGSYYATSISFSAP